MYVYMCMYVCVCMYVYVCVCMYVCMYVYVCMCMDGWMDILVRLSRNEIYSIPLGGWVEGLHYEQLSTVYLLASSVLNWIEVSKKCGGRGRCKLTW